MRRGFFLHLVFVILIQFIIRWVCMAIFHENIIAVYLVSDLLIATVFGILCTPPGFRKTFYKQPEFHKISLTYFAVFVIFDILLIWL